VYKSANFMANFTPYSSWKLQGWLIHESATYTRVI